MIFLLFNICLLTSGLQSQKTISMNCVVRRCKLHWLYFSITQQTKHTDDNNWGDLGDQPAAPTHWCPQASHQPATEDWFLRFMGRGQLLGLDVYQWVWEISQLFSIWLLKNLTISYFPICLAMILNEFLLDVLSTEICLVTGDSYSSYSSEVSVTQTDTADMADGFQT